MVKVLIINGLNQSLASVQVFQSEVFKRFLDGTDLIECYNSVAAVANQWLDVLVRRDSPL